jgi:hypothetical protein
MYLLKRHLMRLGTAWLLERIVCSTTEWAAPKGAHSHQLHKSASAVGRPSGWSQEKEVKSWYLIDFGMRCS